MASARPRRLLVGIGATYAAQGFGYATAVTALPGLKTRVGMSDATVSVVVQLGCFLAALGSVLAETIAVRRGSHAALGLGLLVQGIALPFVAASTSVWMLLVAFGVYGIGLGTVDASSAMQGVQLQHRTGRSVLSTLFACYTGAAIVAALTMSGLAHLGTARGAVAGLCVAAGAALLVTVGSRGSLVRVAEPESATPAAQRTPLPTRGIWLFGSMILVAFVADSAVSTWSSVYLHDSLRSGAVIAPLGYAAYQAAILVTRLIGDRMVRGGRARVLVPTVGAAILGLVAVSLVRSPGAAIVAFALVGVGVGTLVPITWSAAGELAPERVAEVIARINLFNYVGALFGAVVLGLLSAWPGLGPAFLLPALLLVPALVLVRRFDHPVGSGTLPSQSRAEPSDSVVEAQ